MALEIERRFLVKPEYYERLRGLSDGYDIVQGYVSKEKDSLALRVRSLSSPTMFPSYYLTIKRKVSNGINKEFETRIDKRVFDELLDECETRIVRKNRKWHTVNGFAFEIDFFKDSLGGLVIAEIELKDLKQSITLPDFIGQEITDLEGISNFDMAFNPEKVKGILCQQS